MKTIAKVAKGKGLDIGRKRRTSRMVQEGLEGNKEIRKTVSYIRP